MTEQRTGAGPEAGPDAGGDSTAMRSALRLIRDVPDYPVPGVLFKDITPLLGHGPSFAEVVGVLAAPHGPGGQPVEVVAGIEARGFILAAPVAVALGVGFVPIRKVGKLPHATVAATYELEYGTAEVEVHADAVRPGQRVLLVDDVLATGGTAAAAAGLVRRLGGELVGVAVLLELTALGGRRALPGLPVRSLLAV